MTTTTTINELNTTAPPTRDSLTPDTNLVHISEGSTWIDSKYLGWVRSINGYEYGTPFGPAVYEPVPYENAGRSWATIVVGKFRHPKTDEVIAWAWRYYR